MNELHWFAFFFVTTALAALFLLAALRTFCGRRWARITEAVAGLVFWSSILVLLAVYAYFLQSSTLGRLIRPEIIPEEPWFGFLHRGTIFMTPHVMAGLLTLFAIAGGFLFASHIDLFLSLIGFGLEWKNLSIAERTAWVQHLISCLFFISVGVLLVWTDAKVFAFRWAYDLSSLEEKIGWEASIAHLIQFAYMLGILFITFILHRAYRRFQEAAGLLPAADRQEEELPQAQERVRVVERPFPTSLPRQDSFEHRPPVPVPDGMGNGRRDAAGSYTDFAGSSLEPFPVQEEGEASEVLPQHLSPFATRRRR